MPDFFKKNNNRKKYSRGVILDFALIFLTILLFIGVYFISFSITGSKMANVYEKSVQGYYLSEAGVQEAIFKLKTDPTWKSAFETLPTLSDPNCSSWSIPNYYRNPALYENGNYKISILNLGCAKAKITVTSVLEDPNLKSQRIIEMTVFKPIGSPLKDFTLFTGGPSEDIIISGVYPLNIYGGSLFSNNNIILKNFTNLNVEKKVLANNNINILSGSQISAFAVCSNNICQANCNTASDCPPQKIPMPLLDFDSTSSSSYYQRASLSDCSQIRQDGKTNCIFTQEEFEKMLWQHYPEILFPTSSIVYVKGDINIRAEQVVKMPGVLVADRDINLGQDYCWVTKDYPYLRCGFSQIFVLKPGQNLPAGLLAKRKINGGGYFGIGISALFVEGLMYSGDELSLSSFLAKSTVKGGIAARKFSLSSLFNGFDLYLDENVVGATFSEQNYSPIISIEHWEEIY
ncbi:MAG: pilus assembly PilX family protein [Minisyncoccia bacterium]